MNYLNKIKLKLNELKTDELNKKIMKIIALSLVVILLIIIFYLSHQDATLSANNSLNIMDYIATNILKLNINIDILESNNELFRTYMHGFVYFALSIITLTFLKVWGIKHLYKISILFVFIYSIIDEIHQYFIPGRSFQISDIIIDFIGNIVGVIIFTILYKLLKLIIKK